MTQYINPRTRSGGVDQIVVPERVVGDPLDEAPFDDTEYVRINGEWQQVTEAGLVPDTLAPKPPTSLIGSGAMIGSGVAVDYELSWSAPTQNTDNSPLLDLAYYVVRWRYAGVGTVFQSFVSNDTDFALPGLMPGVDIEWGVLARDTSGNDSTWATNTITGIVDAAGPAQPSIPLLSTRLATVSASWDGEDHTGAPPPADFSYLEFYESATTGGPWTSIGRVTGIGSVIVTGATVGEERFFSSIAYDTSGNPSPRSAEASITVVGVTGPDIMANAITANEIDAGYVYTGALAADQITSGTISSDITISGSFSTALSGQRSVMDGFGIRQFGPDGESIITDLPNEGNPRFTGIINAFGLIVNGGLEFRGQDNLFAMGSVVTMATTTSGSAISPSITPVYELITADWNSYLWNAQGVHRESDGATSTYVTNFFGYTSIRHGANNYNYPEIQPAPSTASKRSSRDVWAATMVRTAGGQRWVQYGARWANGLTTAPVGFEVLDLGPMTSSVAPTTKTTTSGMDAPGWFTTFRMGRCFSPTGSSTLESHFAFVSHNTYWTGKPLTFRRYAVTDTSVVQQGADLVVNHPEYGSLDVSFVRGVTYGSSAKMGFPGADQNIWIAHTTSKSYVWDTSGNRLPEFDFPSSTQIDIAYTVGSTAAGANGFVRFESGHAMQCSRYSNIHWVTPDSPVWWACYTWRDDTGTVHESDMSAINSTTMQKRMSYTLTAPNLPDPAAGAGTTPTADDVNGVYFYMGRGASKPARTAMWKQNSQPADAVVTKTYSTMPQFSGTTNPPLTTTFTAQAAAKFQSSALGADGLPKVLITGDGVLHGESLDVSGVGAAAFTGKAFEQLYYSIRAQTLLTGGGVVSVSASYEVDWSARFMVISAGRNSDTAVGGYFQMDVPAVGTVIQGYGGATNKTVTAAGIPLNSWDALWYELPFGSAQTSIPGNFKITSYTSSFVVPNNWVLICIRNSDASRVDFANGDRLLPGQDNNLYLSSASAMTAATGWTVNTQSCARVGRVVQYYFIATRTGATITSNANGDIGNTSVATIDVDWRPVQPINLSGSIANGALWGGYINAAGTLTLSSLQANVSLANNAQISGSGTGLLA